MAANDLLSQQMVAGWLLALSGLVFSVGGILYTGIGDLEMAHRPDTAVSGLGKGLCLSQPCSSLSWGSCCLNGC